MSKTKKVAAAALAVASLAATPATYAALGGSTKGVQPACGTSSSGCR
jgi:hypothetical protein